MKAKGDIYDTGLLEYLEDIIESNKHIDAIEKLEQQLDDKYIEKSEKLSKLRAVQFDLKLLEENKN